MKPTTRWAFLGAAILGLPGFSACAGTELEMPANHPGQVSARPGKIRMATPLSTPGEAHPAAVPSAPAPAPTDHSGHDHSTKKVAP